MSTAARALVRFGFVGGRRAAQAGGHAVIDAAAFTADRRGRAIELAPTVRRDGLSGGLLAYDGQLIDDARLVTAVARTAAQHGAQILTRVGASNATGTSVTLTDQRSGESFDVSARAVINASGVWAGEVDTSIRLRPSRGTHLVFDAEAFGNPVAALTIPIPGEINRFVFAMPEQLGRVYLGLTDEDAPGPIPDVPQPTSEEIAFLLDTVNTALDVALGRDDVIGAYAGLRPLIDTRRGASRSRTADVSRDHAVVESPSGVISVIGGKLTEYRYMAEDVLDRAVALRGLTAGPCRTRNLPLVGAPSNPVATLRSPADLPPSLVARYGAEAPNVIAAATLRAPDRPGGRRHRRHPRGIRVRGHPRGRADRRRHRRPPHPHRSGRRRPRHGVDCGGGIARRRCAMSLAHARGRGTAIGPSLRRIAVTAATVAVLAVAPAAPAAAETGMSNGKTYSVTTAPIEGTTPDRLGHWDAEIAALTGGDPAVVEAVNHASRTSAPDQIDEVKAGVYDGEEWNFESNGQITFRSIAVAQLITRQPLLRGASRALTSAPS